MYVCVLQVVPGETLLAFYKAKNNSDRAITGIATYNVIPYKAGDSLTHSLTHALTHVYVIE